MLLFVAAATFGKVAGMDPRVSPYVYAQEKPQSEHKLIEFHMALLKRGPKWTGTYTAETEGLESEQRAYVASLLESGKAVVAGRLDDDGEIRGVYILRAKSAAEGRAWAEASPGVKAGQLTAEMHPWWSEDVMKKPTAAAGLITAYLGFLKRGEKWTPEKTPATAELQKAHLANIYRLAEMKKLVVAGPLATMESSAASSYSRWLRLMKQKLWRKRIRLLKQAGWQSTCIRGWCRKEFFRRDGHLNRELTGGWSDRVWQSTPIERASGIPIMITFNVAGFLTDFTNGQSRIVVESPAATVAEALESLWRQHLGLRDRVVNEQGNVRQHVNIFLNDENVRRLQLLETALPENCEITILPAVSGGESEPPGRKGRRDF